jgi:beta-xylosidase
VRPSSEPLTPVEAGGSGPAGSGVSPGGSVSSRVVAAAEKTLEPWRDPSRPVPERVADLMPRMTLAEKLAQLGSVWLSGPADGSGVAPLHGEFTTDLPPFADLIRHGLGQLTRVFGTRPLHPAEGAAELATLQVQIVAHSRFGIPAIAHEECLTGVATWTATIFPTPLAWGASFDPGLVRQMAAAIGGSLRAIGVHQGLAPVLDVARDLRWGRVEETIGADPYLVGVTGTAYVRGLESAGIMATLKHFAGYSGSAAGRNLAPVSVGRREFADVFLPPFEMALREGGARSVMHSYAALDGVPPAADRALLTGLLREQLGFDGVVVADYYGISFLEMLHGVAGSPAEAAGLALRAGVDVELPTVRCYGEPLAAAVSVGDVPEQLVDRAVARVLRQKIELGLLDHAGAGDGVRNGVTGSPAAGVVRADTVARDTAAADIDLDPPEHRALARRLAEESVVLLANDAGTLPLPATGRLAVVGPLAADPLAYFGCYTFPRHVGHAHPGTSVGVPVEPLVDALRRELPQAWIEHAAGCEVRGNDRSGFAAAIECAEAADVVVAVLGDEAGLFGRGTSGEGCDATDLRLPGVQGELLEALAATGKPVVLVLITGRPYAIGPVAGRLAAVVQAFFPGQEGGGAIAGVLAGRVVPSGKLPVELPRLAGMTQTAYRAPQLGTGTEVSSADVTPLYPFGHGLSYTTFEFTDLSLYPAGADSAGAAGGAGGGAALASIRTDGTAEIACTVRNGGQRTGTEVVQLYVRDPVAQVVRPVRELAGFARITLRPGQSRRVVFRLHADRTAFCGLSGERVVEAGLIEIDIGSSSADLRLHGELRLHGPERTVGTGRVLFTPVAVLDQ